MPIAKIQLPDGRIAKFEVPDGTTQEEVMQYANEYLGSESSMPSAPDPTKPLNVGGEVVAPPPPPVPEPAGYGERLGEDLAQRGQNIKESLLGFALEGQSAPSTALQLIGQSAGGLGDIIGEGFVSAGRGIAEISPDFIKEPISKLASSAGQYLSNSQVAEAARFFGDEYGKFEQENPIAGRNLAAVGNILSVAPAARGAKVAGSPALRRFADEALEAASESELMAYQRAAKSPLPTFDELKDNAQKWYAEADRLGGVNPVKESDAFVKRLERFAPKTELLGEVTKGSSPVVDDAISRLSKIEGKPITLTDADGIVKMLNDKIAREVLPTGAVTPEGMALSQIKDDFVETFFNATKDLPSGKGFNAARQGAKEWANSLKHDEISRIMEIAELRPNPAQYMQTQLSNIVKDKRKFNRYTPEQQKIIKSAAKDSKLSSLARIPASMLSPIITMAAGGGISGTSASALGSLVARGGRDKLQALRTAKILESIAKESKPFSATEIPKKVLALPAPNAARPMTDFQIREAQEILNSPPKSSLGRMASMQDYGDVPYNYIGLGGEKVPLALPAPSSDLIPDGRGGLRLQIPSERDAAISVRQKAQELGSSLDVRKAVDRMMRGRIWDSVEETQKKEISRQIEMAWKQNNIPLEEVISQAKMNVEDVATLQGRSLSGNQIYQAFIEALNK